MLALISIFYKIGINKGVSMLERFTIGQLASLFNINIQTLYFYDKKGILVPSSRNAITGVREYSFQQVQQLSTILYLKKCGFSLDEINETLKDLTPENTREKILEKSDVMMNQWREIVKLDDALRKKLKYTDEELNLIPKLKNTVVYRKKRYFLELGGEEAAYGTETLYYNPIVVLYSNEGKMFGALVDKNDSSIGKEEIRHTIKNGNFLITYHRGLYTGIPKFIEKVINDYPELEFSGNVYAFDLVEHMNCSNTEDYITKLELELKK